MNNFLTPWAVLTANAALLAFLIGLYTLVGREQKSPYVINSVFFVLLVCVGSAVSSVLSVLISYLQESLILFATALLLLAFVLTCWRVYIFYVRFNYFVDRVSLKNFGLYRVGKDAWRKIRSAKSYEHNTDPISSDLLEEVRCILTEISLGPCRRREPFLAGNNSLTVALEHQGQATDMLTRLAVAFLNKGHLVQYLTASRHPIEFVSSLKDMINPQDESSWNETAQRVVVVDAFTPHFGFTDSIHTVKTEEIKGMGISYIRSSASYPGMHTAASKAFNLIKDKTNSPVRPPTLVIYEDTRAIADLESHEQYRIFVRHVLPSERMWGGMYTVFTEVAPPDEDWTMLSAYASLSLDMRPFDHSARVDQDIEK